MFCCKQWTGNLVVLIAISKTWAITALVTNKNWVITPCWCTLWRSISVRLGPAMLSSCVCCKYLPTSYQHTQWQVCQVPILLIWSVPPLVLPRLQDVEFCLPLLAPPLNRRIPMYHPSSLLQMHSHIFLFFFLVIASFCSSIPDAATLISICRLWLRIGMLGFGFWLVSNHVIVERHPCTLVDQKKNVQNGKD